MKFALLAADAESLALADAAVAAGHTIAWREDAHGLDAAAWEDLYDPEAADAAIVGAGGESEDLRARQVQELTKVGRPLLIVHPVVSSVISYFEIDMARTESGAVLVHYNPLVEPECVAKLASWVHDGHPALGAVEQITATRRLVDRSRERVLWHFARDVELLARLAGRLDRIGAHAAMGDPEAAYASLSVQLLGPRQIPVRWSVEPLAGRPDLRVTLICQRGRLTLAFDVDGRAVELVEEDGQSDSRQPLPNDSPAASALTRFVAAVDAARGTASTWPAALDAMELADSIEISLRRGRMIDVHHRELTEQLAFKGVMSAAGCGVLVVVIPLILTIGWIAGAFKAPLSDYWPHVLLMVLVAFLALQVLPKLLLQREPGRGDDDDGVPPQADSAD
jgi:hypothetical protein